MMRAELPILERRRLGNGSGGIMTPSKAFWQAFPNLACFRPRISKQIFGGFVGFQRFTREKNAKCPPPKFSAAPASLWSHFRYTAARLTVRSDRQLAGEPVRRPSAGRN